MIAPLHDPNERVAVTAHDANAILAGADHTSTGPLCTLRATALDHVRPHPDTPENDAPGPPESLDRYATTSAGPDVLNALDRNTVDGVGCDVRTTTDTTGALVTAPAEPGTATTTPATTTASPAPHPTARARPEPHAPNTEPAATDTRKHKPFTEKRTPVESTIGIDQVAVPLEADGEQGVKSPEWPSALDGTQDHIESGNQHALRRADPWHGQGCGRRPLSGPHKRRLSQQTMHALSPACK